ncbi:sulfite exporter TauE/SafE family protein [Thiohalocapsa marina]|uniref:Probable membrane transporter protein n=1 Tax=Thiohalocapsa marina TaxID=424902 RepID=A0A5M8FCD7_9GAMM|nr:sulfite exporter TauE/SafE family protein [Thiohalocapsa marina]KAA6182528.1 sulfite exporter TauE/SafE family protein [Thiohalocapsa marina]
MVREAVLTLGQVYSWHRRRLHLWLVAVASVLALIILHDLEPEWALLPNFLEGMAAETLLAVFLGALVCEYIDSSLGMGYGTTLTPLLLLAGFEPLQIVPAVLFSELLTGITAGALHHHDGNLNLLRDTQARRTVLLLSLLSAAGALTAVTLAISIPKFWLSVAIVTIVLTMGVLILATRRRRIPYRAGNVVAVGLVAAFNKGLSGGGYGPLATAGQIISGLPAKQAVAITCIAEAFTCLVGLAGYLWLTGGLDWSLATPLALGALLSVPVATLTVKRLPESSIRTAVGLVTLALGLVSLAKLIG